MNPAKRTVALLASTVVLALPIAAVAGPADAATSYKNCTALHKKYPHGVGKTHAEDKTSSDPVTDFKRSTKIYKKVTKHHKGLDRDHDGIACEAH